MAKDEKVKSKGVFKKALLIYSGVLVLLTAVGLGVLWAFLSSYQQSLPETVASSFVKKTDEEHWKSLLSSALYGSPFSDVSAEVDSVYNAYVRDNKLTVRRSTLESKNGVEVFKVKSGDTVLFSLSFTESGSGSFGMKRWKNCGQQVSEAFLEEINPEKQIIIPLGAKVTVDGVYADIKGETVKSPNASVFEKSGDFVKYAFRLPFGETDVQVTFEENALDYNSLQDGCLFYDLTGDRITQTVSVPEGAEVYVNDVRLTTEFISKKGADYPFLNPLELALENAPKSTEYTVSGLYNKPVFRVVYDGTELECTKDEKGKLLYAFVDAGVDYTVSVPVDASVVVNGVDISGKAEYISQSGVGYPEVDAYAAELENPVQCVVYSLKGMFFSPRIKVTDKWEGKELTLKQLSAESFVCNATPDPSLVESYKSVAENFTVAMMEYMFFGRDKLNQTFANALSYTRKDSQAYNSIRDSYSGMYWRREYVITYNSLYADSFVAYADNAFMCEVHYDVVGNAVNVNRTDYAKGVYRLLYVRQNGRWELVEFAILSE